MRISLMFEDEQSLATLVSRVFSNLHDVGNISPIIVSGALFIAREVYLEAHSLHQRFSHYCNKNFIHYMGAIIVFGASFIAREEYLEAHSLHQSLALIAKTASPVK